MLVSLMKFLCVLIVLNYWVPSALADNYKKSIAENCRLRVAVYGSSVANGGGAKGRNGLKKTTLYINNTASKSIRQTIKPKTFTLGGGLNGNASKSLFRNLTFYRSFKREDQIKRLFNGVIAYSSLVIFSPLNDGIIEAGLRVNNLAPEEAKFIFLQK